MLIEFSVSNYRSIKDLQTLSFLATAMNEHEETNTFKANDKIRLLKTIGIYGANGSGKSNVVKALWAMVNYIKSSSEEKRKFNEHIQPFKLNTSTRNEGTFFQLIFIVEEKTYRYGFVYNKGKIEAEWLFGTAKKNEVMYFTRENSDFDINRERFKEGIGLEHRTREDNLFLNVCNEFNGEIAKVIMHKFHLDINVLIYTENDNFIQNYPFLSFEDGLKSMVITSEFIDFVKIADTDIVNLKNTQLENEVSAFKEMGVDFTKLLNETKSEYKSNIEKLKVSSEEDKIISQRKLFDENQNLVGFVEMDFEEEASEGTKKMFNYAAVILKCIKQGKVLIIDEFESKFHPNITKAIIRLFDSVNNKTGQLCFVTHNTNLLDKNLLRRDQIYFTEKNTRGETKLYSLCEFKGLRNDASYEKDYLSGKYGATPFVEQSNTVYE
jgi:uncharacterized protein